MAKGHTTVYSYACSRGWPYLASVLSTKVAKDGKTILIPFWRNCHTEIEHRAIRYFGWDGEKFIEEE